MFWEIEFLTFSWKKVFLIFRKTETPKKFLSGIGYFFIFLETETIKKLLKLPGDTYHLLCSACVTYGDLCHAIAIGPPVFPPNACLGKKRIFLGMVIILTMCLCSHSWFTSHQIVLSGKFCLCVRSCYGLLYFSNLCFIIVLIW